MHDKEMDEFEKFLQQDNPFDDIELGVDSKYVDVKVGYNKKTGSKLALSLDLTSLGTPSNEELEKERLELEKEKMRLQWEAYKAKQQAIVKQSEPKEEETEPVYSDSMGAKANLDIE